MGRRTEEGIGYKVGGKGWGIGDGEWGGIGGESGVGGEGCSFVIALAGVLLGRCGEGTGGGRGIGDNGG